MKYLFTIGLMLAVLVAFAQKQNVYFMKKDGRHVEIRDSADFIRIVREPDSGTVLYNVLDFTLKGEPVFTGKSSTIDPVNLQGAGMWSFPNGKRKTYASYKDGHFKGDVFEYYPNGKVAIVKNYQDGDPTSNEVGNFESAYTIIHCADSTGKISLNEGNGYYREYDDHFKNIVEQGAVKNGRRDSIWTGFNSQLGVRFTEYYENGILKEGAAVDSAGRATHYKQRRVQPQYTGGAAAFYKYLGHNIVYPDYARAHNIQGKVVLSFTIKTDGKLKDVKLLNSVNPEIDAEAIRVVKNSSGWIPGNWYGIPINVYYIVPISFSLQ